MSDRIGRKPVLIIGLLGTCLSYLWLAQAGSVLELGLARLVGGLMAGNVGAAFAAAADLADDKTRARNMGLLGAGVGLGFIVGPALGGFLIDATPDRGDFARVCIASAALAALAALFAAVFFRESSSREARRTPGDAAPSRLALLASRPVLIRFIAVMFLMIAAQALMETIFGIWSGVVLNWTAREVAWSLSALGLGAAFLQGGAAGAAARALGERLTLAIGLMMFAAGLCGMAASHEVDTLAASLTALVVGIGLATPALNSLIAGQAGAAERGAVMGLSQSAAALGRVAGPLCAGALFDGFGPAAPFVSAALLIMAALFAVSGEPQPRERPAEQ